MRSSLHTESSDTVQAAQPTGLRLWLIGVSVLAVMMIAAFLLFGWAVNMDTMYDMSPRDPLVRQDAIEKRIVFWVGITILSLLQAAAMVAGWRAFARRRTRLAFGLSLLVAVPAFLCLAAIVFFTLQEL
jgi:magnesium-transporting ATPase (P-type)